MQITQVIDDETGEVVMNGARQHVDLSLIDAPRKDEYVIVHAGFAIERLRTDEAESRLRMFDDLAKTWREAQPA